MRAGRAAGGRSPGRHAVGEAALDQLAAEDRARPRREADRLGPAHEPHAPERQARVTLTLRTSKSGGAITLGARTATRVKAGRTARYSLTVDAARRRSPPAATTCAAARASARARRAAATPRASSWSASPRPARRPRRRPRPRPRTPSATARRCRPPARRPARSSTCWCSGPAGRGRRRAQGARARTAASRSPRATTPPLFTADRLKDFRAVVLLGDIGSPLTPRRKPRSRPTTRTAAVCSRSARRSSPSRTGAT